MSVIVLATPLIDRELYMSLIKNLLRNEIYGYVFANNIIHNFIEKFNAIRGRKTLSKKQ